MMGQSLVERFPELLPVIQYIREAHGSQKRNHGAPYYLHPIAVAEILAFRFGITNLDILIAALLHDVLEDTDVTYNELSAHYGRLVADIVLHLTKPKKDTTDKRSASEGAQETYSKLAMAPAEARVIKVADRIHNVEEMFYCDESFQRRYFKDTERLIACLEGTRYLDVLKDVVEQALARYRQRSLTANNDGGTVKA